MKRLALAALVCASCSWFVHEDPVPDTLSVDLSGPWVDDSTPTQIVVLLVQNRQTGKLNGVAVRPGDDSSLGFVSGDVGRDARGEYTVHLQSLAVRVPPTPTPGHACTVGMHECCGGLSNCFCQGHTAGSAGVCRANGVSFTMAGTIKLNRPSGDPVLDLQGTLSLQTAQQTSQDTDVQVFLRRAPEWYRAFFGTDGSPPQNLSANPDLDCLGGTSSSTDTAPDDPDVEGPGGQPDLIPDACLEFLENEQLISVNARNLLTQYRCGDGVVQPSFGEQCDDGNANDDDDCVGVCVQASCGDGFADIHGDPSKGLVEECDNGADNNVNKDCLPGCKLNTCGDGNLDSNGTDPQRHEECDQGPGNSDDNGDCVHCQFAKCGDGVTHTHHSVPPLSQAGPLEQCDDANASDEDHCLTSCTLNVCGDGHVDRSIDPLSMQPYEQCDLGAANNQNGDCIPGCRAATCGDGFLHTQGTPPFEVCEPPAEPAAPGCNASCTLVDTDDFQVNTTYTLAQESPAVAAWPDGSFVIVFQSADTQQPAYNYDIGIRARLFNDDGGPHTSAANPLGFDFLVNAHLEGRHTDPVVTTRVVAGQKSFVVAWMKLEGGNFDVEARVFDGNGNPMPVPGYDCDGNPITPGDEFCVPYTAPGDARHAAHDQAHPSIASDATGNFVIVYDDDAAAGPDTYQKGIRARLYGADAQALATPLGDQNTDCTPTMTNMPPSCCATRTCDFQINTTYAPTKFLPDPTQCNGNSRNCYQVGPNVAMNDSGAFVVSYVDFSQDPQTSAAWPPDLDSSGGNTEIRARVFGAGGMPVATPMGAQTLACDSRNVGHQPSCCAASTCDFLVNTTTAGDQDAPVVGVAPDGSFLVAWADQSVVTPVTDPNVRYRAFLPSGAARDRNDRLLTTTTANWQTEPTGSRGPSGFFFAWTDSSAQTIANPSDIRGISLSLDGTQNAVGDFQLNLTTLLQGQTSPSVAVAGNGTIIVAFKDASYANPNCTATPSTPDCIEAGVRAHIFYLGRTP